MNIITVKALKRIAIGLLFLIVAVLILSQFFSIIEVPPYIAKKPSVVAFRAGIYGAGELTYDNGIPVMILRGTPQEMGEQQGNLLKSQLTMLVDTFLDRFLYKEVNRNIAINARDRMRPFVAEAYQKELQGISNATSLTYDRLLLLQTIIDEPRLPNCSAVLATSPATALPDVIFGRNLDFVSLGVAEDYSLITVYHPRPVRSDSGQENETIPLSNQPILDASNGVKIKKSFASITWPGFVGVLSGINEDGLSLALLLSFSSWGTNTAGTPSLMLLRQVLEEASTVDEAIVIIKNAKRVSPINLALADAKNNYAIVEITSDKVAVRLPDTSGLLYCTNWFVTKEMASGGGDGRYGKIEKWAKANYGRIGLDETIKILQDIAMFRINLQSMVFYPKEKVVYLATGSLNSAKGEFKKVDLAKYLK